MVNPACSVCITTHIRVMHEKRAALRSRRCLARCNVFQAFNDGLHGPRYDHRGERDTILKTPRNQTGEFLPAATHRLAAPVRAENDRQWFVKLDYLRVRRHVTAHRGEYQSVQALTRPHNSSAWRESSQSSAAENCKRIKQHTDSSWGLKPRMPRMDITSTDILFELQSSVDSSVRFERPLTKYSTLQNRPRWVGHVTETGLTNLLRRCPK